MKKTTTFVDMQLPICRYTTPEKIPLRFSIGGNTYKGLPDTFSPKVNRHLVDANMIETVIEGQRNGLAIRIECLEYRDFDAVQWLAYIENISDKESKIVSDFKFEMVLSDGFPELTYSNGETCKEDGYEIFKKTVDREGIALSSRGGLGCFGAFPYMRLSYVDFGVNIAVGWPAQWEVTFKACEGGVHFTAGQQRCHMKLLPGERIRSPRITLVAYAGDETRGRNVWRRFYFTHIIPRENGYPIPPKLVLHDFMQDGYPEFTGATEKVQLSAFRKYIERGLKPDIWWIDAGWYPCDFRWTKTGTWTHNEKHFPNGLAPIGEICQQHNVQFLLWFEPERVQAGTWLYENHPEWLIKLDESPNCLLNLALSECQDWLIEHVDALIKNYKVRIYRQDFNFTPLEYWTQIETDDRIGAVENLHVQGYLRFFEELILRNPGLWIDSCASGGRRNDPETMRYAVPLHYTDVGYGNHPIKQKQYRLMHEWIPYFRSHTTSWDNEDGTYDRKNARPFDEFAFQTAVAPAVTVTLDCDDEESQFEIARRMMPIWRRAADMMLKGDYYPLSECRKSSEDYYAVQFDCVGEGFIQVIRNVKAPDDFTLHPMAIDPAADYYLENSSTGEIRILSGEKLASGLPVKLPGRSGVILFYKKIDTQIREVL